MGQLCNRSSHKDEEIIILKGDVNNLRSKLERATREKLEAIDIEKREREENAERVLALEEETKEKLKKKDLEVRNELGQIIEEKDEQIEKLSKEILNIDTEASNKVKTLRQEYEDQLEMMKSVHESVVEEMETEIKLTRIKAQEVKEKYERRMSILRDELRDVIEAAETSLSDKTICKADAIEDIIWMIKKVDSPGTEIPKAPERGVAPWRASDLNSEELKVNYYHEDEYEEEDYGEEEYEEEEVEEVKRERLPSSSSDDEVLEGALRILKSKGRVGTPAPVHNNKPRQLAAAE